MTKFSVLTLSALLALPAVAFAQSASELDTNGDGVLTIDEVQVAYPDISSDDFAAMDLNADGALDGEEVASAQEAGIMPTQGG